MVRFVVQGVKEDGIVEKAVVYELSVCHKTLVATLFRMIIDLSVPHTIVEDFGDMPYQNHQRCYRKAC